MPRRPGAPGEGEVPMADLVANVKQDGVHPRVEEGTSGPDLEHIDDNVPKNMKKTN